MTTKKYKIANKVAEVSFLEDATVYCKIAEETPDFDTFVFHGSAAIRILKRRKSLTTE